MTLCHPRLRHHRPANNEQKVSFPWGRWEFRRQGWHVLLPVVEQGRIPIEQQESNRACQQGIFPSGQWECCRSLRHVPTVVDRSVRSSCVSCAARVERQASQQFSHRGDGKSLRSLRHVPPGVDRSVTAAMQLCKRESRQARQQFSHQGDVKVSRSLRHAPPVVNRSVVCSCASVSRGKCVSHFPIGAMGTFEHEHAHC
jgi:hypothetical protein